MFFMRKKSKSANARILEYGNGEFKAQTFRMVAPGMSTWMDLTGKRYSNREDAMAELREKYVANIYEVVMDELFKQHQVEAGNPQAYRTAVCEHPDGCVCIWCIGGPPKGTPEEQAKASLDAMKGEFGPETGGPYDMAKENETIPTRFKEQWRHISEWNEEIGECFWTKFPVVEPYYSGSPLCHDWMPDYYTHFIPQSIFNVLLNERGYPKQ